MLRYADRIAFTGRGGDRQGNFTSRAFLTQVCQERGIIVVPEVDHTVALLVASRTDTSKAREARRMGVPVVVYREFWDLLPAARPETRPSSGTTFRVTTMGENVRGSRTLYAIEKMVEPRAGELVRTWFRRDADDACALLNTWAQGLVSFPCRLLGFTITEGVERGFVALGLDTENERTQRFQCADFQQTVRRIVTHRANQKIERIETEDRERRERALKWYVTVECSAAAPFCVAGPKGGIIASDFPTLAHAIQRIRQDTGEEHSNASRRLGFHDSLYWVLTLRRHDHVPHEFGFEIVTHGPVPHVYRRWTEAGARGRVSAWTEACVCLAYLLAAPSGRVMEDFNHLRPSELHALNARRRLEI